MPEKFSHELEAETHHWFVRDVLREEDRTRDNSEDVFERQGSTKPTAERCPSCTKMLKGTDQDNNMGESNK